MIWARMLAYITGTVDQELLLRNEYLAAENRILRAGRGQAGYYAGLVSQAASLAFSNRSSFLTLRRPGGTARPEKSDCIARCQPAFGTAKAVIASRAVTVHASTPGTLDRKSTR